MTAARLDMGIGHASPRIGELPLPVPTARLRVRGLRHRYGAREALHGLDLELGEGEIVCLVGASGCGKSTALRLVAGLEPVQQGEIEIDGLRVAAPDLHVLPERRDVGMVFQDFALFPHLSVLDNVAFGLANRHPRGERARIARDMLVRVGLEARAADPPHTLSGGQQQRVALARALAPEPRLLLLDEPFSSLDVRLRHRMRVDTVHLLKESRTATVLVTHDPEEAMFMADRIVLLREGRVVQAGRPLELYRRPADSFAAEFFGDVNRFDAVVVDGHARTPLGVATTALAAGSRVQVLVRPEAVLVVAAARSTDGIVAHVRACHVLGASTLVELSLPTSGSRELAAQAVVAGALEFAPGSPVSLRLDPQGVFVFA